MTMATRAHAKQTSEFVRRPGLPIMFYLISPDGLSVDAGPRYWSRSERGANRVSSYTECGEGLQTWPLFHFPWLHYPLVTKLAHTSHFSLD